MSESAILFKGVRFGYEGSSEPLFRDLSFSIGAGGYAGIVGGNGSGKTTALRLLLGLLRPSEGEILLFGTPIADFSAWESVGYVPQYVFQREREFPATVREIVESGHTAKIGSSRRCQFGTGHCHPVDEALRTAEIGHLAHRLIGELSGGERQRVFIARALVSKPKLLVLDEPTANVDAASQEKFFTFLSLLNRSGMTIVLVSHDIDTVFQEAKSVFSLENGMFRERKPAERTESDIRHAH
jgi:zinc transport system ATP-binding protein